ncbi:hypothetical protein H8N03_25705 [Ramlibacter sp. USB13]|uniref:Uncharacterized protein n=1 Tax=Ramlibacter cellulosilyticus TaxID=2764187 RepID=A0A923MX76_9BURK|nr:hypothetical protein [Ramlibacter cellulosilyticus]MBC5786359.1 hypothetical protein [Ramlibacter cellulosilyticus]
MCRQDLHCQGCRAALASPSSQALTLQPGIPVRRYGTVPPLDDEPAWVVEPLASGEAPRTIAEYGGTAVLLAAAAAAAVAGWLLYAH